MTLKIVLKVTTHIVYGKKRFLFFHQNKGVLVVDKWMKYYGKFPSVKYFKSMYKASKGKFIPDLDNIEKAELAIPQEIDGKEFAEKFSESLAKTKKKAARPRRIIPR
jgi:hypothetical protein